MRAEAPRVQMPRADPERVTMGNYVHNPQTKASASGAGSTAGCSNAVTPIPTFLPTLVDAAWAIGLVASIISLLDDEDERVKNKRTTELVKQTIDLNEFLPTSVDDFTQRVVGTT